MVRAEETQTDTNPCLFCPASPFLAGQLSSPALAHTRGTASCAPASWAFPSSKALFVFSSLPLPVCNLAQTVSVPRTRPHAPSPGSVVLGTVTRLSPVQALVSIGVVDGVPLPAGEEFVGVIRTQDVRATEKDRVKIGDCFRGGDVVRGLVVRVSALQWHLCRQISDISWRCPELLCDHGTQRPRGDICDQ